MSNLRFCPGYHSVCRACVLSYRPNENGSGKEKDLPSLPFPTLKLLLQGCFDTGLFQQAVQFDLQTTGWVAIGEKAEMYRLLTGSTFQAQYRANLLPKFSGGYHFFSPKFLIQDFPLCIAQFYSFYMLRWCFLVFFFFLLHSFSNPTFLLTHPLNFFLLRTLLNYVHYTEILKRFNA